MARQLTFKNCAHLFFFFSYVNLNNKVRITKHSPSGEKFGGSHETVQQNTSVTMPAAGGKIFQVPPPPQALQGMITLSFWGGGGL